MFSKKALPALETPATAGSGGVGVLAQSLLQGAMSQPHWAFGGAAGLFLLAAAGLIAVMGDPHAGAPSVRMALLGQGAAPAPAGWREALAMARPGPALTEDRLELFARAPSLEDPAHAGDAVIHLPQDGSATVAAALPPAPIAGLSAPGPNGPLPIIAPDGRRPSSVYAQPFVGNGRPKVALVIGGLGLNARTTRQAIETLPPEVTLSFVPYAEGLQGWIDLARANGHEVLLETPMEPVDYPENDPGPYTLMADSRADETIKRLEWLLSRATGYFGVTNYLGSKFVNSDVGMGAFLTGLRQRGLAFIDDGSAVRRTGDVPRASADRILDDQQLSAEAIDKQLMGLEISAQQTGQALGSGFAYPVTLDRAAKWSHEVSARGLQLAPASAIMARR